MGELDIRYGYQLTNHQINYTKYLYNCFAFAEFDKRDKKLTSEVCTTCLMTLIEHIKGKSLYDDRDVQRAMLLPDSDTYEYEAQIVRVTRSSAGSAHWPG